MDQQSETSGRVRKIIAIVVVAALRKKASVCSAKIYRSMPDAK